MKEKRNCVQPLDFHLAACDCGNVIYTWTMLTLNLCSSSALKILLKITAKKINRNFFRFPDKRKNSLF